MVSVTDPLPPNYTSTPDSIGGIKFTSLHLTIPQTATPISIQNSTAGRSSVESFKTSNDKGSTTKMKSSTDDGERRPRPRKKGVQFVDMVPGGDVWQLIEHGRDSMYMRAELQRELDFGVPAEEEAHRYARWCEEEAKREAAQEAAGDKRYSHDYAKADIVVHPKRLGEEFDVEAVGDTTDLFSRIEATLAKEVSQKKEKEKPAKEEKEKKARKFLKNIIQEKVLARTRQKDEQNQSGKNMAVQEFIARLSAAQTSPASSNKTRPSTATVARPTPPELPPRPPTSDSSVPPGPPPHPSPQRLQSPPQATNAAQTSKTPASLVPAASTNSIFPQNGGQVEAAVSKDQMDSLRRVLEKQMRDGSSSATSLPKEMKNKVSPEVSRVGDTVAVLEAAPSMSATSDWSYQSRTLGTRTTRIDDIVKSVQLQASNDGRRPSVASVGSTGSHRLHSDIVNAELGIASHHERHPSDASVLSEASNRFPFSPNRKNAVDSVVEIVAPKPRLPPIKPSDLLQKGHIDQVERPTTPQLEPSVPRGTPSQNNPGVRSNQYPASQFNLVGSLEQQVNGSNKEPQKQHARKNLVPLPPTTPSSPYRGQRGPSPGGLPSQHSSHRAAPPPFPPALSQGNLSTNPTPIPTPKHSPLPPPTRNADSSKSSAIRMVTPESESSQATGQKPPKSAMKQTQYPPPVPSGPPPAVPTATATIPSGSSSKGEDLFSRIEADIAKDLASRKEVDKEKHKYGDGHHREHLKTEGRKIFGKVMKKVK